MDRHLSLTRSPLFPRLSQSLSPGVQQPLSIQIHHRLQAIVGVVVDLSSSHSLLLALAVSMAQFGDERVRVASFLLAWI